MHFDLYLTGYRNIAIIGVLFLVQAITAVGIALGLLIRDRARIALAGAGFALSNLIGYLLSRTTGIFGFHEIATQAGTVSGILELLAFLSLSQVVLGHPETRAMFAGTHRTRAAIRSQVLVGAIGIAVVALIVIGAPLRPGSTASVERANSSSFTASITISNFAFVPARLSVVPGERILVVNRDSVAHSVTSDATSGSTPVFNSGNIEPGHRAVIVAPRSPGSYAYFCDIHNFMTGVIRVSTQHHG